ncbi:MAG: ADP-ribosylglycohydrolase family protein [Spirochaetota bacterium]
MSLWERVQGALLGLAVGDALGTTLEFSAPGTFEKITGIVGGGPFHLQAGEWTDDTSMALCLADSLISCEGFDPVDQMKRYSRWYKQGYLSSNGWCFDIGNATRTSLELFQKTNQPYAGSLSPSQAGNGSLMRLAPVPIYYHRDLQKTIEYSLHSSRTTHGTLACLDACRIFGFMIGKALQGYTKNEVLDSLEPLQEYWQENPLSRDIAKVYQGSYKSLQPPEIQGSGYVVKSLEAALWAFCQTDSFSEGALLAVNLGDDADTTGAIYGQIAGAHYGVAEIPQDWLEKIKYRDKILEFAEKLLELSE